MRAPALHGKSERNVDWPRSPGVLFGIAASFFAVMSIVVIGTGVLDNRLPILRHGHIAQIQAGYFVLLLAIPFAIFAVIYGGVELAASRVFQKSATRIHFVCTFFAVVEAIRVYASWAVTTGSTSPDPLTRNSFGGVIAFLTLASAVFVWNVSTSTRKSGEAR
jgi:hypothetical protein